MFLSKQDSADKFVCLHYPDAYDATYALKSQNAPSQPVRRAQRARRDAILATARFLLAQHGYSGVTIRMLSERLSISPQTIHNLAGPRRQLLSSAVCQHIQSMVQFARADESYSCFLLSLANTFGMCALLNPEYIRESTKTYYPPEQPLRDAIWDSGFLEILGGLREMRDKGQLRPDTNLRTLTESVVFITNGAILAWISGAIKDEDLSDVLIRAYRPLLQCSSTPQFSGGFAGAR